MWRSKFCSYTACVFYKLEPVYILLNWAYLKTWFQKENTKSNYSILCSLVNTQDTAARFFRAQIQQFLCLKEETHLLFEHSLRCSRSKLFLTTTKCFQSCVFVFLFTGFPHTGIQYPLSTGLWPLPSQTLLKLNFNLTRSPPPLIIKYGRQTDISRNLCAKNKI